MHAPPALSTYRPRPSVAPRAVRPVPEMCAHFAPRATCITCRVPLVPPPVEHGLDAVVRREEKRAAADVVLRKVDARRSVKLPPPPKVPREAIVQLVTALDGEPRRRVKNGHDKHGRQIYKMSRAKHTREEALRILHAAGAESAKARRRMLDLDGEPIAMVVAAERYGLTRATLRARLKKMTVRQALGLDPMPERRR